MSHSDKVAIFTAVPVTVDFVMSSLLTNSAVMCLQFLFRELENGRGGSFNRVIRVVTEVKDSFSLQVEYRSGYVFYGDCILYDGGQGSVHGGESC